MDHLTQLALAARDGDQPSLAGFVRASQRDVWRLAAHLVDAQSADDVTQEVYLRAIPALSRYRAEAPAKVWLLTIARRTCADVIRRRGRRRRLWDRLVEQPDPAGVAGAPPVGDDVGLTEMLDGLDPDRRQAFVLTQVVGLSYAEAAEVADVAVGTIRSRVSRARHDLVTTLQDAERDIAAPRAVEE